MKLPCSQYEYSTLSRRLQRAIIILVVMVLIFAATKGRAHVDLIEPALGLELWCIYEQERMRNESEYEQVSYNLREYGTWQKDAQGAE